MEICLLNQYHEDIPLNLGLTYLILFVKKEEENEKTPTNLKFGNFFETNSNKKEKTPIQKNENLFSAMNNSQFKKERSNGKKLLNNIFSLILDIMLFSLTNH